MAYPIGRYSDDTLALQRALVLAGFDVGKAGADGEIGDDTIKAIIAAREHYALEHPDQARIDVPLLLALGVRSKAPTSKPPHDPNLFDKIGAIASIYKTLKGLTMTNTSNAATVDVKSAWFSKLNWTMGIGVIFNLFMLFGHPVPADIQTQVYALGNSAVLVVGWIIKTWFTTTISAAAAKKL